jgi:hypothetical protein
VVNENRPIRRRQSYAFLSVWILIPRSEGVSWEGCAWRLSFQAAPSRQHARRHRQASRLDARGPGFH